jgi:predicted RNase H-like nuclease
MNQWAGVDGCRGGWVLALLSRDGSISLTVRKSFTEIVSECSTTELVLVDIPIGLPSSRLPRDRDCDLLARKLLKGKASSVFPVPCREALNANTYDQACEVNQRVLDKKLSLTSWGICKKIQEVDKLFRKEPSLQKCFRETHPELCFRLLNDGKTLLSPKRRSQGKRDREKLLQPFVRNFREAINEIECEHSRKELGRDDLLDAIVAAILARLVCEGKVQSIPCAPEYDASGLRMEMLGAMP